MKRVIPLLLIAASLAAAGAYAAYRCCPTGTSPVFVMPPQSVHEFPVTFDQRESELSGLRDRINALPDGEPRTALLNRFEAFEQTSGMAAKVLDDQLQDLAPITARIADGEIPAEVTSGLVTKLETLANTADQLASEQAEIETEVDRLSGAEPKPKKKTWWQEALEWLRFIVQIIQIILMVFGSGGAGAGAGFPAGGMAGDGVGVAALAGSAMTIGDGNGGSHIARVNGSELTVLPHGDIGGAITVTLPAPLLRDGVTLKDVLLPGAGVLEALFRGEIEVDIRFGHGKTPEVIHGEL